MRQRLYPLAPDRRLTLTLDGARMTLDLTRCLSSRFIVEYPVPIEGAPVAHLDLAVWLIFGGLGLWPTDPAAPLPAWMDASDAPRVGGGRTLLAYSAGVDSTAASVLWPSLRVMLDRRHAPEYLTRQRVIAERLGALIVRTDVERIGQACFGVPHGFRLGIAYAGPLVPMLHALEADTIAQGVIWDDAAFWYGEPFRHHAEPAAVWRDRLALAERFGVRLVFPVAALSEVISTRVADESGLPASSCHGRGELHCGACYKCFRREGHRGRRVGSPAHKAVHRTLQARPLKMASSAVAALQRGRYGLRRYDALDVGFTARHDPAYAALMAPDMVQPAPPHEQGDAERIRRFVTAVNDPALYEGPLPGLAA